MTWGVKQSFRSYVTGNIARGDITVKDGATLSGGSIQYPASASSITGDSKGVVRFGGTVNFTGHSGVLDLTLSDIAMRIDGRSAELTADYSSREFEGVDSHTPGPLRTGNDVVFAKVALNSPANFSANSINLAGKTTLTADGVEVFGGFYEAGAALDNTAGTLSLEDSCGKAPEDTGGSTGGGSDTNFTGATDSGATEGIAGLVGTLNDTLVEVNGLIVNSGHIMDNSGRLYDRVTGGSGSDASNSATSTQGNSGGQASTSTNSPTGKAAGNSTSGANNSGDSKSGSNATVGTNAGASAASGTSTPRTASAAGGTSGGSGNVCQAGDSIGITSAEAEWGIRSSFRNYISGSIAQGGWELAGVEESGDTFIFSGDAGAVDPSSNSGTILFPGSIRFHGHSGTLDTTFSNLEIEFSGDSGQLLVNAKSNDVDGNPKDYGRIALANLNFSSLNISESSASGTAATTLTGAGADAFGNFYPEGDSLDDISFNASLGGDASCAEGQGTGGSATGTGGGSSNAAELRNSGGAQGGSGNGSVSDEFELTDSTQPADDGSKGNPFRIKDASVSADPSITNSTILLLLLGAFVVAGTTLTSFGRKNPN